MSDAPRPVSPVRLDLLGLGLMMLALGLGLLTRALLPEPGDCVDLGPWPPLLLTASVAAFAFGFVRCLAGRARRIGWYVATGVSLLVMVSVFLATTRIGSSDCG